MPIKNVQTLKCLNILVFELYLYKLPAFLTHLLQFRKGD